MRAQEVLDFGAGAQDPSQVEALHDLRIAAKRLRYLLELTRLGPCAPVKPLKRLQDLLGEIHDCDVQLPPVRALGAEAPDARRRAADARHPTSATRRAELSSASPRRWPELLERALHAAFTRASDSRPRLEVAS